MSVAGVRNRESFGTVAGPYRVLAGDTGLITLVPAPLLSTIYVQKIHIQITTPSVGELWTFQDGAGIPLVPAVSAGAIAHFDFNFGPDGVPCTEATAFVLNISGATGAIGWITWSAYRVLTRSAAASRYADLVLADRPSSYWRLNETSGLTAVDLVGGHNGAITGGVTLNQPGALASGDKAMAFDGTTGYLALANSGAAMDLPGALTIEAWVNLASSPNADNWVIARSGITYQDYGLHFPTVDGGVSYRLAFNYFGTPTGWIDGLGSVVPRGVWTHVAVTRDAPGTLLSFYINGAQTNTVPGAGQALNPATGRNIGYDPGTPGFLKGSLDEVAIYPYALTAQQILAHFQAASRP